MLPEKKLPCPICKGESTFFESVDGKNIYRCRTCGHGFLYPYPGLKELQELYTSDESEIFNSNSFELLEKYLRDPGEIHDYYRWFLDECNELAAGKEKKNVRILDLGCSCGVFTRCLLDQGYGECIGIDINPIAARIGKEKLGVTILSEPVEKLPADEKFDCIMAIALLEHLNEPHIFLKKMKEHLRPGGKIFFVVPNFNGFIRTIQGKSWLWYMPPYHVHHFTLESMQRMVAGTSLKLKKLTTLNTGTYIYLIYYTLFGIPPKKEGNDGKGVSLRLLKRIDQIFRFFFSPFILLLRTLDKEAHIVGVLTDGD